MDAEDKKRAASSEEAAVDALVRAARPEVPLPNSFQSEVWRRIAVAQENSLSVRWASWMDQLFGALAHPVTASGLTVVLAAMGFWLGTGKETPSPITKLAYVEAVSPFARTMPHSYDTGEEP
jgi:hypothetical protein